MKKFVPYEKLSKKQQREIDSRARVTWGAMSPVTRKPEKSGAYNRKKHRRWTEDVKSGVFYLTGNCLCIQGRHAV